MYKEFINGNYKNLLDVLNCLKVGVYITDGAVSYTHLDVYKRQMEERFRRLHMEQ